MVNDICIITKDENAVMPLLLLLSLLLLLLSISLLLLGSPASLADVCEFPGDGEALAQACGANRRTVIAHAAPVPPRIMSSITIRNMESAETPPSDIRLLHDFLLVDDDVVLLF